MYEIDSHSFWGQVRSIKRSSKRFGPAWEREDWCYCGHIERDREVGKKRSENHKHSDLEKIAPGLQGANITMEDA